MGTAMNAGLLSLHSPFGFSSSTVCGRARSRSPAALAPPQDAVRGVGRGGGRAFFLPVLCGFNIVDVSTYYTNPNVT